VCDKKGECETELKGGTEEKEKEKEKETETETEENTVYLL